MCRTFIASALFLLAAIALEGQVPTTARADELSPALKKLLETFASEFVEIRPGEAGFPQSFVMGTDRGSYFEQPAHKVTFAYQFAMAKYEVPQNLYESVMGQNPSKWKGPRNSAEMFSFVDAESFCEKLTRLLHQAKLLEPGEEIRLPSEAEWEYCCRAGGNTQYGFGDAAVKDEDSGLKASLLDEYAWHTGNAAGNDPPVGAKKPNGWGLYDMHGYLWEFVTDVWHETYSGAPADGRGWLSDDPNARRVIRGGSWKDRYDVLRCASRRPIDTNAKDDAVGLRCVKAKVR